MKGDKQKEAIVYKRKSGLWAAEERDSRRRIGGLYDTEMEAYRVANNAGYLVI